MSYTGNVSVGGPADTRDLPGLTITKVSVGPMDNNAYLLRCTQTGQLGLIDAANDAQTLLDLIDDRPVAAIITSASGTTYVTVAGVHGTQTQVPVTPYLNVCGPPALVAMLPPNIEASEAPGSGA